MKNSIESKHLLTGEELTVNQIEAILQKALVLKKKRLSSLVDTPLKGQHLALLFNKPSLRTRFSFTIAMCELGGDVIESISDTRKQETPEDLARVLERYCHAIMVRTDKDAFIERMSKVVNIPIINGLSDLHHPCQVLGDLLTLLEHFGSLKGLTLSYIGDGNNVLNSLLLLAPKMGVNIHYCCPPTREPDKNVLEKSLTHLKAEMGHIKAFTTPELAVAQANAVYTDVWTSMGFEGKEEDHLFKGFQVNQELMQLAHPEAIFMHCLPMERGKEVSDTLPDARCSVIFQQSENRLHVQKAILLHFLKPSTAYTQ